MTDIPTLITILGVGVALIALMATYLYRMEKRFDDRIDRLDGRIDQLGAELRAEIRDVRTELRAEIRDVQTELRAEIREVRAEIQNVRSDIAGVNTRIDRLIEETRRTPVGTE